MQNTDATARTSPAAPKPSRNKPARKNRAIHAAATAAASLSTLPPTAFVAPADGDAAASTIEVRNATLRDVTERATVSVFQEESASAPVASSKRKAEALACALPPAKKTEREVRAPDETSTAHAAAAATSVFEGAAVRHTPLRPPPSASTMVLRARQTSARKAPIVKNKTEPSIHPVGRAKIAQLAARVSDLEMENQVLVKANEVKSTEVALLKAALTVARQERDYLQAAFDLSAPVDVANVSHLDVDVAPALMPTESLLQQPPSPRVYELLEVDKPMDDEDIEWWNRDFGSTSMHVAAMNTL